MLQLCSCQVDVMHTGAMRPPAFCIEQRTYQVCRAAHRNAAVHADMQVMQGCSMCHAAEGGATVLMKAIAGRPAGSFFCAVVDHRTLQVSCTGGSHGACSSFPPSRCCCRLHFTVQLCRASGQHVCTQCQVWSFTFRHHQLTDSVCCQCVFVATLMLPSP